MGTSDGKEMTITYRIGDATAPIGTGPKIIVHVCNDLGKWGKGFVLAINKRWKEPEAAYRAAFAGTEKPALGDVQFVQVEKDIEVANIIGQHGVARRNSKAAPPIRYPAIRQGLESVARRAIDTRASVHMPRIGCGLAGGSWDKIEPIIFEALIQAGISTTVYDFQ